MFERLVFLVMLLASSCRSTLPGEAPAPSASAPQAVAIPPPAPVPPPELRVVACGVGGVGPVGPPSAPDAWVVVFVEVASAGAARTGLRAGGVTLIDPAGAVVGRAQGAIEARVAPPGRSTRDFSSYGTSPFDGDLPKGASVLLHLQAALDARLAVVSKTPLRARVTMVNADGARVTGEAVECTGWPSG